MLQPGAMGCYHGDAYLACIGALPTSPEPWQTTPHGDFLMKPVVANSIAGGSKNLLRLQQNGVIRAVDDGFANATTTYHKATTVQQKSYNHVHQSCNPSSPEFCSHYDPAIFATTSVVFCYNRCLILRHCHSRRREFLPQCCHVVLQPALQIATTGTRECYHR